MGIEGLIELGETGIGPGSGYPERSLSILTIRPSNTTLPVA